MLLLLPQACLVTHGSRIDRAFILLVDEQNNINDQGFIQNHVWEDFHPVANTTLTTVLSVLTLGLIDWKEGTSHKPDLFTGGRDVIRL